MPAFEKIPFSPSPRNLCYYASQETIGLQEEAPFGVKLEEKGSQNHFWTARANEAA